VIFLCGETFADTFAIHAVPSVPETVKHWISYQMLGPLDRPHSIVYIATRRFKTAVGESLITLPRPMYARIANYTHARINSSDCAADAALRRASYSIEITEHEGEEANACVLPQALACEYLSGVGKLSGVDWTASDLKLITNFMTEVRCAKESKSGGKSDSTEAKPK